MNQRLLGYGCVVAAGLFMACGSKATRDETRTTVDIGPMGGAQAGDAPVSAGASADEHSPLGVPSAAGGASAMGGGSDAAPDGASDASGFTPDVTVDPNLLYVEAMNDGQPGDGSQANPFRDVQTAIDAAADGGTIQMGAGTFRAEPRDGEDPTCGNCDNVSFTLPVPITMGFVIEGKSVHLRGAGPDQTVLHTGAGYGVYFNDAGTSSVEDLKITGGVRDANDKATDAAIVVRYTDLTVRNVDVIGNDNLYAGEPDPVVGIIGIAGREGARLSVVGCRILDNSWDGIALYRSDPRQPDSQAKATIIDNEIGCTSNCVNPRGRGVGVGVTWDAEATVVNNRVHHYWKGIGSFGVAQVVAANNIVEHQVGWGIIVSGESTMDVLNNVIAHNGTTGLAAWNAGVNARFVNNIVWNNGTADDEWVGKRTGLWLNAPETTELSYNVISGNRTFDACSGGVPGAEECVAVPYDGVDGNMAVEPVFTDSAAWTLSPESPLVDGGDPEMEDNDGTRSDVGIHGGPEAGRTTL